MVKYIYNFYLSSGFSPTMITAIVHALIGTVVIIGAIMLQRVYKIIREIQQLKNDGYSEVKWNESVDEVIREYQIKHVSLFAVGTYAVLLLVNYILIITR